MSTLEQIDKDVSQKVQGIPGFLQEQDIPRLLQEQDIPGFLQEQGLGILGPFEMNETGYLSWALGCSDLNQTDEIMVEACSYWIEGVTLVSNVLWPPHPPPLKKNNLLCFLSITESQTITKIKQYTVLYSCYTFVLNKYNAIQKMCSFLHRFGIVFTLVWHRFCIGLGSFFHRKGIVFASVWDRLCIGLGSFLHQFGIVFASVWDRFCIVFGSFFPYIFCQGQKLKKCA